jgi:phenylpropionate dioxygenase-like ring-hydroxylating dioxygenase large terminal subunit
MMPNYPKKCWYVGATSDEIVDAPVGRQVLDTDIVFWRSRSGTVHAFEDRCAHRAFPLSGGRVDGERLVCGYHGCTYDADGRCEHVPTQPEVPTGMRVQAFPVVEDPPFVWVWLGPTVAAARTQPPRTPWITQDGWSTFASTWRVTANYMMVHEHYLDFTYAPVVHPHDVPPDMERLPAFDEVEVTETTVSYTRTIPAAPLADWEAEATGLDRSKSYARRERGTFASPAMHIQRWEIDAGDRTYAHIRTHALTPETSTSTHVFMYASRNYAPDREIVTSLLRSFVDELISRESEIVEIAAAHGGYDGWQSGVEFQADAAALRARRIVAVMLAKEAGRSATRPGLLARANQAVPVIGS